MRFNQKGISIVGVLIASGILGGLALVFSQLMKNVSQGQVLIQGSADELSLENEIKMIISSERFCRVSLAGNGPSGSPDSPITFQKSQHDSPADEDGIPMTLYYSDSTGEQRTLKRFDPNSSSGEHTTYGKLRLNSIEVYTDNNPGTEYSDADGPIQIDMATMIVKYERQLGNGNSRSQEMKIPFFIKMAVSGSDATIHSCALDPSLLEASQNDYTSPSTCSMRIGHKNHTEHGWEYSPALNMFAGGIVGVRIRGTVVNQDDDFSIGRASSCSGGNDLDTYFEDNCRASIGFRNNATGTSSDNLLPTSSNRATFYFNSSTPAIASPPALFGTDDALYFRLRCMDTNPEISDYLKNNCQMCIGLSKNHGLNPDNLACKNIQSTSDASWGIIKPTYDLNNGKNYIFLGFSCSGSIYSQQGVNQNP